MKFIDIVNKIANGEKIPMFEYENHLFKYNEKEKWFDDLKDDNYCKAQVYLCELNDEIEIIEEDKKIEKIDYGKNIVTNSDYIRTGFYYGDEPLTENERILLGKLNEIIDYINNKE